VAEPAKADLSKYKSVLVVSAHPDDPEFGFGATVAQLAKAGATVNYVVVTDGSQGGEDPHVPDQELTATRYREQRAAADELGVREIVFLGYRDGHLVPDIELRKAISREIRKFRPDLVLTHHPQRQLGWGIGASHPDHLAVGEATLAAVYPDARNPRAYRELLSEGYEPFKVKEVWLPSFDGYDLFVDASDTLETKIRAIRRHESQFQKPDQDPDAPDKWIRERAGKLGEKLGVKYAEAFKRLETA
jgi:LmbE family N-acetylglucosaminyl deacetylase